MLALFAELIKALILIVALVGGAVIGAAHALTRHTLAQAARHPILASLLVLDLVLIYVAI